MTNSNPSFVLYDQINSLDEVAFIAGTTYVFHFSVYEENGVTPVDLQGATIKWTLSPYGESAYSALEKTATITGTNTFDVSLTTNDTKNLSGKFIQQPVVIAFGAEEYRPAQGVVLILPRTPLA